MKKFNEIMRTAKKAIVFGKILTTGTLLGGGIEGATDIKKLEPINNRKEISVSKEKSSEVEEILN